MTDMLYANGLSISNEKVFEMYPHL